MLMRSAILLIILLVLPMILLAGCNSKRELKTVVCISKKQPEENKCLEKQAIDTKDTAPCDKITPLRLTNSTYVYPTKNSCYAQVAFWKADPAVCYGLPTEMEKSECKDRYELYMETAKQV
jgi:hypothetical protein